MADISLAEGARLFAIKMNLGAYQEAAKIKSDFGLPNDMLIEAVRLAYDANIKKGDYSLAADLAKKYDLPEDLRLDAAERSFIERLPIMPESMAFPRILSGRLRFRLIIRA